MALLKRGSTGDDVKALQALLSGAGVGFEVPETGTYGAWTDRAVRTFQKRHGLKVDGVVGAKTMAALQPPLPRAKPAFAQTGAAEPERVTVAAPTTPVQREPLTPTMANATGFLQPGNIDLDHRPVVRNPDGSISTIRSMSFNEDGREMLVPTVAADGSGILSDQAAIDQYHRTGQNLGAFADPETADRYAQQLHQEQAVQYGGLAQAYAPPAASPIPRDPDQNITDPSDPNYEKLVLAKLFANQSNMDTSMMKAGFPPVFGTGAVPPPARPVDVSGANSPFAAGITAYLPATNR